MPVRNEQKLQKSTLFAVALVIGAGFALPGCSTSSADKEMAADQPQDARSDVYPDFSKPLTSAMPQMSDEEAARQEAQLSALAGQRKSGAISEAEYNRRVEELRKLNEEIRAKQ